VGIIGCGYWGPNLVRTFVEIPGAAVRAVADRDRGRLDRIAERHPYIEVFTEDLNDLLQMSLDAVIVCTPPETHHDIVTTCLEHGLDVLVEKPLATDAGDARKLAELAEQLDRVLMVGHIGAYNPAVTGLREMIDAGTLGEVAYIDAVRVGLGMFRANHNVIWDLAPHDIAILMYLLGETPKSVSTRGMGCVEASIEDVAYMTLSFPSGVLAHVRLSWLDPCKTRRITVVGNQKMVVYDDLEAHEKLKVYDKSVAAIRRTDTFGDFQFAYHYGNVLSPYIEFAEPLRLECLHFLECVTSRARPLTDGRNGLAVVEVIEAAQVSLRKGGAPVSIPRPADDRSALRWRPVSAPPPADLPNGDGVGAKSNGNGNGDAKVSRKMEAKRVRKVHRKAARIAAKAGANGNGANGNSANGNGANGNGANGNGANGNGKGAGKAAAKTHGAKANGKKTAMKVAVSTIGKRDRDQVPALLAEEA
jgi:predicted dehydrogenase